MVPQVTGVPMANPVSAAPSKERARVLADKPAASLEIDDGRVADAEPAGASGRDLGGELRDRRADRVGLPGDVRVDREMPWSKVPRN